MSKRTEREEAFFQHKRCFDLLTKKYNEPNNERTSTLAVCMAKWAVFFFIEKQQLEGDFYWQKVMIELDEIMLP